MPELSRFEGIILRMWWKDVGQHNKPHFHAYYGKYEAVIGVDGELIEGALPVKKLRLVLAWAVLHEEELYTAWNKAVRNEPFEKIAPLK